MNEIQGLALVHYLTEIDRQAGMTEWRQFKLNAAAAAIAATNPQLAKAILELDDPQTGDPELPGPLSDEELSRARPVTAEDMGGIMDALDGFGIRMN